MCAAFRRLTVLLAPLTTAWMHDSMDGGGRAASGTAAEEVEQRREQLPRDGLLAVLARHVGLKADLHFKQAVPSIVKHYIAMTMPCLRAAFRFCTLYISASVPVACDARNAGAIMGYSFPKARGQQRLVRS